MLFVVFVATIERLFGFFSCCERVTYFQVVMTGKTLKQKKKKKIKKEKGNNSSSSSSQPHAGDNCFSQTLKLCDFSWAGGVERKLIAVVVFAENNDPSLGRKRY